MNDWFKPFLAKVKHFNAIAIVPTKKIVWEMSHGSVSQKHGKDESVAQATSPTKDSQRTYMEESTDNCLWIKEATMKQSWGL